MDAKLDKITISAVVTSETRTKIYDIAEKIAKKNKRVANGEVIEIAIDMMWKKIVQKSPLKGLDDILPKIVDRRGRVEFMELVRAYELTCRENQIEPLWGAEFSEALSIFCRYNGIGIHEEGTNVMLYGIRLKVKPKYRATGVCAAHPG